MLLMIDSFDHYATADIAAGAKWQLRLTTGTAPLPTVTIDTGTGRRGTNALKVTYGTAGAESVGAVALYTPTVNTTLCCCGFAFRAEALPVAGGAAGLVQLLDGTGVAQVALALLGDGRLAVCRGKWYGTQIAVTPGPVVGPGVSIYIEVKITIAAGTGGTVDVQVNGVSVLSATGLNTQASANANWAQVQLGVMTQNAVPAGTPAVYFDDFYLLDGTGVAPWTTFLGDCRVEVRRPTAEGAASDWAPSTGTDNAVLVADVTPDADATYVSASSAPLTDTHLTEDATLAGILAVQSVLTARKTDAGACTLAAAVRSGGQVFVGPAINPGTSYNVWTSLFLTDPATNTFWTLSGFNAAEFGYRRTI